MKAPTVLAAAAAVASFYLTGDIIVRCDGSGVGVPGRCSANVAGYPPLGGTAVCHESAPEAGDAACQKNCVVYAQSSFTLPADKCTPSYTPTGRNTPRSNIMSIPEGTGRPTDTGFLTIPDGTDIGTATPIAPPSGSSTVSTVLPSASPSEPASPSAPSSSPSGGPSSPPNRPSDTSSSGSQAPPAATAGASANHAAAVLAVAAAAAAVARIV